MKGFRRIQSAFLLAASLLAGEAHANPRLYSTEDTKAILGRIVPFIPKWAGVDVMVVRPQDISALSTGRSAKQKEDGFKMLAAQFPEFPVGRIYKERFPMTVLRIANTTDFQAYPLPARESGQRRALIIIMPDMAEKDPRYIAGKVAAVPAGHIQNLPGTFEQWLTLAIAHEAGHAPHSFDEQGEVNALRFEKEADQSALDNFTADAEKIFPGQNNLEVAESFVLMRSIKTLNSRNIFNNTAAALRLSHEEVNPAFSVERLIEAKTAVYEAVRDRVATMRGFHDRHYRQQIYTAAHEVQKANVFSDASLEARFLNLFIRSARTHFSDIYVSGVDKNILMPHP